MPYNMFTTSVVGSWPRPAWLLDALRRKNRGEISYEEFSEIADDAVLAAVKYQEDAGIDVLTDGEQRRDNFYSFVADKIDGIKLMSVAEVMEFVKDRSQYEEMLQRLDVPAFSIRSPVVAGELKKRRPLALDELEFLRQHTSERIKVTLPGPYMLTRASWIEPISMNYYWSRDEVASIFVRYLREEIIALRDSGAYFIQLDEPTLTEVVYGGPSTQTFMCAAIFSKLVDPKDELEFATELVNKVVKGISGVKLGVHICRGNWSRREDVLLKGDYKPLVPYISEMKVDQFVLEFATSRAGDIDVLETSNVKEIGLGVINPRTDEIEDENVILQSVKRALKYFDPERIYLNPDCGFGTFAERPVNTSKTAFLKLRQMVKTAEMLREEYS